jgi:hypothetical protein
MMIKIIFTVLITILISCNSFYKKNNNIHVPETERIDLDTLLNKIDNIDSVFIDFIKNIDSIFETIQCNKKKLYFENKQFNMITVEDKKKINNFLDENEIEIQLIEDNYFEQDYSLPSCHRLIVLHSEIYFTSSNKDTILSIIALKDPLYGTGDQYKISKNKDKYIIIQKTGKIEI